MTTSQIAFSKKIVDLWLEIKKLYDQGASTESIVSKLNRQYGEENANTIIKLFASFTEKCNNM